MFMNFSRDKLYITWKAFYFLPEGVNQQVKSLISVSHLFFKANIQTTVQ